MPAIATPGTGAPPRHEFAGTRTDDKARPVYDPTEREREFLMELEKRYDPSNTTANYSAYHRQWWVNLAFFIGLHWLQWNDDMRRLEAKPIPSWRRRFTANRMFSSLLRAHSKLLVDEGLARVGPASTDREDINAAKNAELMLEHCREVVDHEDLRSEVEMWALICGSGFRRFWWNPLGGEKRLVSHPDGKTEEVQIGELEADVASPFSIRVPLYATKMRYMPWIVQVSRRPMEYVYERWPDKAMYVTPSTEESLDNWMEERIQGMVGQTGIVAAENHGGWGQARIIELFAKPTLDYPNGLHGTVCNGVVVDLSLGEDGKFENPYVKLGVPLPFIKTDFVRVPGRFWGMSLAEQMIAPQREYNISRSQIIENKELMSRPKWLVPRGHGIPKHSITSAPGEIIEYNPTLPKPEQVDIKPLPNYVMDHIERCVQEMNDISAQQEVTQAKAPASIRSGIAISLLQQADQTVLAEAKRSLLRSDRECFRVMLKIVSQMYAEPRIVQVLGRDAAGEVVALKGADLRGHTDVRVFAEAGLIDSKAARQQGILDYVQLGILNPQDPDEKVSILKGLDIGDVRSSVKERLIDERRAEAENALMLSFDKPSFPQPRDFEDHAVHIKRHNLARKSEEYRALPADQQAAMDYHVSIHNNYLMAEVQAQMAMMDAQKGTPGEKGKASPPGSGGSGQAATGNKDKAQESGSPKAGGPSGQPQQSGGGGGGGEQ